jgi:hypothetical protein
VKQPANPVRVVLPALLELALCCALPACSGGGASPAAGRNEAALCSGKATLTASPAVATAVGSPVTFTLTPACDVGDTAQWQLYVLPKGGTWSLLSDWSTTLTYNWDTTNVAIGTYFFEAHVASTNSDAGVTGWDSYVDLSWYNVNPPGSCGAVSASISPQGAAAGSALTITGAATCPSGGTNCAEGAASGCPQYRFWVRPFGGKWEILQDWSDSASATFVGNDNAVHSGSFNNHDYRFEVDARAIGNGNQSYDVWTEVDYDYAAAGSCPPNDAVCDISQCVDTQNDPNNCGGCAQDTGGTGQVCPATAPVCATGVCGAAGSCSAVTGNASPSPAVVGDMVTLSANATCSAGGAEYLFWIQAPGGSWTVVQDYSASNTYAWATTGLTPGIYRIEIDAKHAGSSGAYEAFAVLNEELKPAITCSSVTATAGPPLEVAGSPVTISAMATCDVGATPEFRYWVQPPGGTWQLLQDWSTNASAGFIGSDDSAGYRFEVDTVAQGNGNPSYDAWTEVDYGYSGPGSCPTGYTTCDLSVCSCGACGQVCTATQTCNAAVCM